MLFNNRYIYFVNYVIYKSISKTKIIVKKIVNNNIICLNYYKFKNYYIF